MKPLSCRSARHALPDIDGNAALNGCWKYSRELVATFNPHSRHDSEAIHVETANLLNPVCTDHAKFSNEKRQEAVKPSHAALLVSRPVDRPKMSGRRAALEISPSVVSSICFARTAVISRVPFSRLRIVGSAMFRRFANSRHESPCLSRYDLKS